MPPKHPQGRKHSRRRARASRTRFVRGVPSSAVPLPASLMPGSRFAGLVSPSARPPGLEFPAEAFEQPGLDYLFQGEVVYLQVVANDFLERCERSQADQLAAGYAYAVSGRLEADRLHHPVDRSLLVLNQVHRNLNLTLLL